MPADANGLQLILGDIGQLLQAGQYNQAADLLATVHAASEQAGDQMVAASTAAVRQITLSCSQLQGISEWHEQVVYEAGQREAQLRAYALSIILGLSAQVPVERAASAAAAESHELEAPTGRLAVRWRQRIQGMLQNLGQLFAPQQAPPEVSANVITEGAAETAGEPAPLAVLPVQSEQHLSTPSQSIAAPAEIPQAMLAPPPGESAREVRALVIYCLGPLRVYQQDQLLEDWNGLKGQAILKYLIAHRGTPVAKDVLIDVFWRDAEPEAARRNLHQAIYSLRQTLRRKDPEVQYVLFENNQYMLNPAVSIWLDFEAFQAHVRAGRRLENENQRALAMVEYAAAESLYQGDFLMEDLYDDWPRPQRERIRASYFDAADRLSDYYLRQAQYISAIAICQKVLVFDDCVEEAHRRLMRCYLAQGQRHLAIRQYHICVQALAEELQVPPDEETTALYTSITSGS
jgi:DNA-binding SARP family transcriptional activator